MAAPSLASQGFNVNPTSVTFGALLFAFLFYATVKGDLAKWFGIFGLASSPAGSSLSASAGTLNGQQFGSVPAIGGPGSGQLGNITGGSGQFASGNGGGFSQLSGGDTGWMNTTGVGNGDTGWTDTSGGDTGWIAT